MLLFALIAYIACGRQNYTCRLDFLSLKCEPCGNGNQWYFPNKQITNYKLDPNQKATYVGPPPVEALSNSPDDLGSCEFSGQTEAVVEASHSCPVNCAHRVQRPARFFFKARVPCDTFMMNDRAWAANGTFRIFDTYELILGSGNPRPLHISFTFDGATWTESIVDVQGDLYASSVGKGEDLFHEVMFDLAKDGTRIFYNGYLIRAMSLGEPDYKHINEGTFMLAGASEAWYNTVLVKDNSCFGKCSNEFDCSGHGTTSGMNSDVCVCDCQCNQDGCWGGPDCSVHKVIRINDALTCAGKFLSDHLVDTWDECYEKCEMRQSPEECGYFAFNTTGCRLFKDCAPTDGGYVLYQNSERICYSENSYSMGSAYVRLQDYLRFEAGILELYFQTPDWYKLLSLEFRSASHPCAQWNAPADAECPRKDGYWTQSDFGCLKLYTGTLIMREVYNGGDINFVGFKEKGSDYRSVLIAQVQEITEYDGSAAMRDYHYIMPFNMEVAGEMTLNIDATIPDMCKAFGVTDCPPCRTCNPAEGDCIMDVLQDGHICDDSNPYTWPDHCVQGYCIGEVLCTDNTCGPCERCQHYPVDAVDSPCPGKACYECLPDEQKNYVFACVDEDPNTFEEICINGICVTEDEKCGCKCDSINCAKLEPGCGCDHRNCDDSFGVSCCDAGYCIQDGLKDPRCRHGYCSQVGAHKPRCYGGWCDQTGATRPTCIGGNCIQDHASSPSCDGGFCRQIHSTLASCSKGCEADVCTGVECPACHSCTLPEGKCELDPSAGGCEDCHICASTGECFKSLEYEGQSCDDGIVATWHDMCDINGDCMGLRCSTERCDGLDSNQDGKTRPCCPCGECSQIGAINPMCSGGTCDQRNSIGPYCDGGSCDQTGATDPDCSAITNCKGNCNLMYCGDCQICEKGECKSDLTQNDQPCDLGYEYVNEYCIDGACYGESVKCFQNDCNECTTCNDNTGDCDVNHSKEGEPCGDPKNGFQCRGHKCAPEISAATMVDRFITDVGVQESNMASMKSDIELDAIVVINWPWYMVDDIFDIESEMIEDIENIHFEIIATCEKEENMNCEQEWKLKFTVDRMCDELALYTLEFSLKSFEEPDRWASIQYDISVAQTAACGVIIADQPITAELKITDETYENPNSFPYINVGKNIYFRLEVHATAEIETLEVLTMSLYVGQDNNWNPPLNIISDGINSELKSKLRVQPVNEGGVLKWFVYLDNSIFVDYSKDVGAQVRMALTIAVSYQQGFGRRLLTVTNEGYDFSQRFFLLEYRCIDGFTGKEALVDTYLEVDCDPSLGRGTILMYCTETGWNEDAFKNLCTGISTELEVQADGDKKSAPWYIWFGLSILLVVLFNLMYFKIPKKTRDYYLAKLFCEDPKKEKDKKKKKDAPANQAALNSTSQNGEPGPNPLEAANDSVASSNPPYYATLSLTSTGTDHSSREGVPSRKNSAPGSVKNSQRASIRKHRGSTGNKKRKSISGKRGRRSSVHGGVRKSLIMSHPPGSSGHRKSIRNSKGGRKSFCGPRRKSVRKSIVGPRKSLIPVKPTLSQHLSQKQIKNAASVSAGSYIKCTSLADAQKMKELLLKKQANPVPGARSQHVQLYE